MTKPARPRNRITTTKPRVNLYGTLMPQGFEQLSSPPTREYLRDKAKLVSPERAIVELGVYTGGSIVETARAANENVRVYGVDPWDMVHAGDRRTGGRRKAYATARNQRIAQAAVDSLGLTSRVSLIRGYSTDVAKLWPTISGLEIGMLYIDAHHTHDAVIEDFLAWRPFLAPGAFVIFDDYWPERFPGVVSGVDLMVSDGLIIGTRAGYKLFSAMVVEHD